MNFYNIFTEIIVLLLFLNSSLISYCIKTYEVRRLNETTFFVTSFPERVYESRDTQREDHQMLSDLEKNIFDDKYKELKGFKIEPTKQEDAKVEKPMAKSKAKGSSSMIAKARENYFRTFYPPKKAKIEEEHIPANILYMDDTNTENKLNHNLLLARKLAKMLVENESKSKKTTDTKTRTRRKKHIKRLHAQK